MNVKAVEEILSDICTFCNKQDFCKDRVMVKGINMIIKEVAPGLELTCKKYSSMLSNTPIGFSPIDLSCKEVH